MATIQYTKFDGKSVLLSIVLDKQHILADVNK